MQEIIKYTLLFFFYSFGGWCLESTYCSIGEKKLINRGFLTGPLCPIYGTAAVVMAVLIYPLRDTPLLVFLFGIIVCDIVEFFTSLIMEKLFAARWWDYTYEFCNLNGRISLKHSLHWGVVSVVFVLMIHPAVDNLYNKINYQYLKYILVIVLIIFALDVANAVRKASDIRKLQIKLNSFIKTLSEVLATAKNIIGEKYTTLQTEIYKQSDKIQEFKSQIDSTFEKLDSLLGFNNDGKKKRRVSDRFFYNNPILERYTRKQMDRIHSLIDDIKANLYEGEEKH